MQIGPRIRIGGSVGKIGQKVKIGVGKVAQKAAPIVSIFNPALGAAVGAAGDVLDTSEGGFSFKKAALDAGRNYAIGKVAGGLKSGVSALRSGQGIGAAAKSAVGMGASGGGELAGIEGGNIAASDPSRFRSVVDFLGKHKDTIADIGQVGESVYDRYQENQDRKTAEERYRALQPLRDQAVAGLMDTSRPDLSGIFADPTNPQARYRRVNVGSRGTY